MHNFDVQITIKWPFEFRKDCENSQKKLQKVIQEETLFGLGVSGVSLPQVCHNVWHLALR